VVRIPPSFVVLALLLLAGLRCFAGSEIFLKLDGIPGESRAAGHANEIVVLAWSWGVSKTVSHVPSLGGLAISKYVDKSTPLLMKACCLGSTISNALLTCRTTGVGGMDFIKITLTNSHVVIASASGDTGSASDSFALNYDRIQFDYFYLEGNTPTTVTYQWDLKLDTDHDGMPDAFETLYGLDPLKDDAAKDKDGDGMSNLDEYLAGTDPSNKNSVFKCTLTYNKGAPFGTLSWTSVPGNRYRILYTDTLGVSLTPGGDFNASNSVTEITIPAAMLHRFYRLQVLPAPR
jgi:type VI secretion system secreted protein Hcp